MSTTRCHFGPLLLAMSLLLWWWGSVLNVLALRNMSLSHFGCKLTGAVWAQFVVWVLHGRHWWKIWGLSSFGDYLLHLTSPAQCLDERLMLLPPVALLRYFSALFQRFFLKWDEVGEIMSTTLSIPSKIFPVRQRYNSVAIWLQVGQFKCREFSNLLRQFGKRSCEVHMKTMQPARLKRTTGDSNCMVGAWMVFFKAAAEGVVQVRLLIRTLAATYIFF